MDRRRIAAGTSSRLKVSLVAWLRRMTPRPATHSMMLFVAAAAVATRVDVNVSRSIVGGRSAPGRRPGSARMHIAPIPMPVIAPVVARVIVPVIASVVAAAAKPPPSAARDDYVALDPWVAAVVDVSSAAPTTIGHAS